MSPFRSISSSLSICFISWRDGTAASPSTTCQSGGVSGHEYYRLNVKAPPAPSTDARLLLVRYVAEAHELATIVLYTRCYSRVFNGLTISGTRGVTSSTNDEILIPAGVWTVAGVAEVRVSLLSCAVPHTCTAHGTITPRTRQHEKYVVCLTLNG